MTTAAADPQIVPRPPAAAPALRAADQGVADALESLLAKAAGLADWEFFSGHSGRVGMARRMAQNGAPTHEIERQGRWKQGGGMVGRYTRGESAGAALRYL